MISLNEWLGIIEECLHQELEVRKAVSRSSVRQREFANVNDGGVEIERGHRAVKRITSSSSSIQDAESSSRQTLDPYSIIDSRARSVSREDRYSTGSRTVSDRRNGVGVGYRIGSPAENRDLGDGNKNGNRNRNRNKRTVPPRYGDTVRSASGGPIKESDRGDLRHGGGGGEMLDKGVWVGVGVGRSVIAERTSFVPSFSSSMKTRVGHFKFIPSNQNTSQERQHASVSIRYRDRNHQGEGEGEDRNTDYDQNNGYRSLRMQRNVEVEVDDQNDEAAALEPKRVPEFRSNNSTRATPQDAVQSISEGFGDSRDASQTAAVCHSYSCSSAIAASQIAKMR